jgi:hypothetical protein
MDLDFSPLTWLLRVMAGIVAALVIALVLVIVL